MGRYQPALLGGLFIGVTSAIPILSNCCCLWALLGGVLVAYLQQQRTPEPLEAGDAVLFGLIAGLIGALIATPITILMLGSLPIDEIRQELEQVPTVSPEVRDMVINFIAGRGFKFVLFAINLPIFAVFAMLGSLLGLAFFRKKVPPQAQG